METAMELAARTTEIPLLTIDQLDALRSASEGPGQVARSWMTLTRLVRDRLRSPGAGAWRHGTSRAYSDTLHFMSLSLESSGVLRIEFGICRARAQVMVGSLSARWDEIGLTGPYRISIRGREESLNTFCAVLAPYLALPPEVPAHRAR